MARIRSIKPDFFTSETIAALPLSARLTFIGLWTYVDDNGVGLDNALLVTAAVWPLESDTPDTLDRTREDLANLSRKGLISRYQDSRKRYLHVTSWREHQKVDHPGKPRYPLPGDEAVTTVPTCDNTDESRTSPEPSREPREGVAPEQGAGSREQGAGIGSREQGVPTTSDAVEPRRHSSRPAKAVEEFNPAPVVAAYVDGATDAGLQRPATSLCARVGKQARALYRDGYTLEALIGSARRMGAGEWNDLAVQVRKDDAATNGVTRDRPVIDRREQARSEQRARQMARAQERERSR